MRAVMDPSAVTHMTGRHTSFAPGLANTLGLLLIVRVLLTHIGVARTVRILDRFRGHVVPEAPCRACLDLTAHRIAVAGALFPGRARCLEQSLVLWCALRRHGLSVALHLGVRPDRPTAHAWVEHGGYAIGQSQEALDRLVRLPVLVS